MVQAEVSHKEETRMWSNWKIHIYQNNKTVHQWTKPRCELHMDPPVMRQEVTRSITYYVYDLFC